MEMRSEYRRGYRWAIVLGLLVSVYLLIHLAFPEIFSGFARVYVAQPVLWSLLVLVVFSLSRHGPAPGLGFTRSFLWIGLLLGVFHVACLAIAGLFGGFGESPYSHRPYPMFIGFAFWATALVGIEIGRAFVLRAFAGRHTTLMIGLVTLLFAALMVPVSRFTSLASGGEPMPFFGGTFLPLLAENLLACFLAIAGGPLAAIAYRGILEAFEWFSPILPNLTWMVSAFVGTLAPVVGLLAVQGYYSGEEEHGAAEAKPKARRRSSLTAWVITSVIAVALVWASFGLLGIQPITVISGSMEPSIRAGDLAIVRQVPTSDIEVGDVIQFQRGNGTTIHRVVEVRRHSDYVFITRGDANNRNDSQPVLSDQVLGKVQLCIPKVGWVSIGVKKAINAIF